MGKNNLHFPKTRPEPQKIVLSLGIWGVCLGALGTEIPLWHSTIAILWDRSHVITTNWAKGFARAFVLSLSQKLCCLFHSWI